MAKVILCEMANGKTVYYENETSHAATHLSDTSQLAELIREFLSKQDFHDDELFIEHEFDRVVGVTDLVETDDNDDIVYAKRLNRDTFTRFVKNKTALPTHYITMHLILDAKGDYELASAWMGGISPPFPDDPRADAESKAYWNTHALVFGKQAIQENMDAQAVEVTDSQEIAKVCELRKARVPNANQPPEDFMGEDRPRRIYCASPRKIWMNQDSKINDHFVDIRVEADGV